MNTKTHNIIKWVLAGLVAFVFVSSGLMKLSNSPATVEMGKAIGGQGHVVFLGYLELVITVLFLVPRTGVAGALLMMAYLGGAIATLYTKGQPVAIPAVIQVVVWLVSAYRFPELAARLLGRHSVPAK